MSDRQHPIDTPFNAGSTADDVLDGLDLRGTNAVVTCGHAGLGLETTRALVKAGASVVVGARTPDRAAHALAGMERVEISQLDLIDPESVDAFVARYRASGRPLHVLINNAGLPGPDDLVLDARGYEITFATNHLGHFQLTLGLLPALRAADGARVVTVTSAAQRFSDIRWGDLHFASGYDATVAYAQSKTANVLFAVELDRRWAGDGILGFAAHPGVVVGTAFNSSVGVDALHAMGLIDESGQPIIDPEHGKKTPEQGASTIVFAATSPLLTGIGGVYLKDSNVSRLDDEFRAITAQDIPSEVASHAIDPQSARRLWEMSEQMIDVR